MPPCLSFACCLMYSYHSSLVIGMMLCFVRLKYCGLDTRILGLGWPLSKVGTRVGALLFQSSPPHNLEIPLWSGDWEHYYIFDNKLNTQLPTKSWPGTNPMGFGTPWGYSSLQHKQKEKYYVEFIYQLLLIFLKLLLLVQLINLIPKTMNLWNLVWLPWRQSIYIL